MISNIVRNDRKDKSQNTVQNNIKLAYLETEKRSNNIEDSGMLFLYQNDYFISKFD